MYLVTKWFNLSDKTRQAIDYICFLSVEHGYFYASPEHIAKKSGIGKSTVYETLKLMRESGVLFKVNRTSRKQNGLGSPIHFFVNHPYFEHYNSYFAFGWKPEQKADWKAENDEIPCDSKAEQVKNVPTLPLHSLYQENNIDIHTNVPQSNQPKFVKYVPQEINKKYANIFGIRLRMIWVKITQAWKTINQSTLNRNDLISIGENIIRRIFQLWKQRLHENGDMTIDEMCAFAYKASRDAFYVAIGDLHMEDMPKEKKSISDARQNRIKTQQKTRSEVLPDWMHKLKEEQELVKKNKQEAKEEIPRLERIYMEMHPDAHIKDVKDAVLNSIKEKYPKLDRVDISEIEQAYSQFTSRKEDYQQYMRERCELLIQRLKEDEPSKNREMAVITF